MNNLKWEIARLISFGLIKSRQGPLLINMTMYGSYVDEPNELEVQLIYPHLFLFYYVGSCILRDTSVHWATFYMVEFTNKAKHTHKGTSRPDTNTSSTLSPTTLQHWRLSEIPSCSSFPSRYWETTSIQLRATYFYSLWQTCPNLTEEDLAVPTQFLPRFSSLPSDRRPLFKDWSARHSILLGFYKEMPPNCYYIRFPEIRQCSFYFWRGLDHVT